MAKRGNQLREHILRAAKDVFLELGFERASMDEVASRAGASKRTLYAHFESKEKLFLAVIDLVRDLFLERLMRPEDYSARPAEALAMFCGRYLERMLYEKSVKMSRVTMAEAERFPEAAARYFDVLFTEVHDRLSAYLREAFDLSPSAGAQAARRLLAQVLYPALPRALFGMDRQVDKLDDEKASPEVDLKPIRKAVAETIASLTKRAPAP